LGVLSITATSPSGQREDALVGGGHHQGAARAIPAARKWGVLPNFGDVSRLAPAYVGHRDQHIAHAAAVNDVLEKFYLLGRKGSAHLLCSSVVVVDFSISWRFLRMWAAAFSHFL
jgi:hypothetical protein